MVGEVEFEFEEGGELEELVAEDREFGGDAATKLIHGDLVGGTVGGCNEVGYGFGLGEVEFAVEVGTLGEFARVGLAATLLGEEGEDLLGNVGGAVERYFGGVFACVGVGRTEDGDKNVVDGDWGIGLRLSRNVRGRGNGGGNGGRGDGDCSVMECIRTGILNRFGKHFAEDVEGVIS